MALFFPLVLTQSFRNPFDIPRKNLVSHVTKMRMNFLKKCNTQMQMLDEDQLHTIPVQEMGNYQDYLKRMPPPLREVENIPVRYFLFPIYSRDAINTMNEVVYVKNVVRWVFSACKAKTLPLRLAFYTATPVRKGHNNLC